jgi:hypothetical protein
MATPNVSSRTRHPSITTLHICAITISVFSGTCALVALAAGSPLEFGVALAFCAAWLIAVDFIESSVERERERAARRCALPAAQLNPAHDSRRVILLGGATGDPGARGLVRRPSSTRSSGRGRRPLTMAAEGGP